MNPPIEENDFKVLLIKLQPVCGKWREFGIALGMQPHLDIINADGQSAVEKMERMLSQWMTRAEETYWSDVVSALDSPIVSRTDLAIKIRDDRCPDFILPTETLRISQRPQTPIDRTQSTSEDEGDKNKRTAALLLGVISLCIVFAFGGITLMAVGIRGLVVDDDYQCSLGPTDVFNSLNLITGVVFLSGIVIFIVYIFFYFFEKINGRAKTGIKVGVIATSLVLLVGDMIYSFYVASELLPVVEKWERNKTLCHEAIFRSSFGIIVTYFLIIFVLIVVGAVALSYSVYKGIRWLQRRFRVE